MSKVMNVYNLKRGVYEGYVISTILKTRNMSSLRFAMLAREDKSSKRYIYTYATKGKTLNSILFPFIKECKENL